MSAAYTNSEYFTWLRDNSTPSWVKFPVPSWTTLIFRSVVTAPPNKGKMEEVETCAKSSHYLIEPKYQSTSNKRRAHVQEKEVEKMQCWKMTPNYATRYTRERHLPEEPLQIFFPAPFIFREWILPIVEISFYLDHSWMFSRSCSRISSVSLASNSESTWDMSGLSSNPARK